MPEALPDIDDLILKVHSTVLEPDRWAEVITDMARLLKADSAMLFSVPSAGTEPPWNVLHNLDPVMIKAYAQSFVAQDEWLIGAQRQGRDATGIVSVGEQLLDRSQFVRSSYYNEFLTGFGMDRFLNVCLRGPPAPRLSPETGMSFYRNPGQVAFGPSQVELLTRLAPHLILAIRNLSHARALSVRTAAYTQTLDQLSAPMCAIDARGFLAFSNRAAERSLSASKWLGVDHGRLRVSRHVRERAKAAEALRLLPNGLASAVLLTDRTGSQALLMTTPLPADGEFAVADSAIGVVWLVPLQPDPTPVAQLAQLFALTPAEGRLLRHLAGGDTLRAAAEALSVGAETVRSQLKSIFRKTRRRTQAELMVLVQRMSAICMDSHQPVP